jgi:GT2 family glycosyltransferase
MLSETAPAVSVITPTHNRSRSLRRLLDALGHQHYPMERLEVIAVADGCQDDTVAMLKAYPAPYRLRVLEQPGRGAAEARNIGAACARGRFFLFIDDDIEPCEEFVASHVRAHEETPGGVVVGPYPPAPVPTRSIFRLRQRLWWTKRFEAVAEPGHRFSYHDLLTGNLSLEARLWARFGGLDPRFREAGGEDYEFGVRLMKASIPLHFARGAHGYHHEHETMSLKGLFRRACNEGHADVIMGTAHPEVRPSLGFVHWYQHANWKQRRHIRTLYRLHGRADPIARSLQKLLPVLERAGLRGPWARLCDKLRFYWYLRGATEALPSAGVFKAFACEVVPQAQDVQEIVLDLREGIAAAEAVIDGRRPESVGLRYGRHILGIMPAAEGSEPWRGAHLRPFIVRYLGPALLRALALDGRIVNAPAAELQRLAKAIVRAGGFYTNGRLQPMWREQYAQWERLDAQLGEISPVASLEKPVQVAPMKAPEGV